MNAFELSIDQPLIYHFTGKFEAPHSAWIHQHATLNDYELIVMTKGTLYLAYNHEKYTVSEGEMLLLPPLCEPHNVRQGYKPSDCSFYWLHFASHHNVFPTQTMDTWQPQPSLLAAQHKLLLPNYAVLPHAEKVVVLMKQLQDAIRLQYTAFALNYMVTVILCEIHHQFFMQHHAGTDTSPSQTQVFNDMVDYIRQNIHTKLTVSDVAQHFGYNGKFLSHMFSHFSSLTLKQFIIQTKIEAANFLLIDTNQSIQAIATSLGFSDSHHFMKCYKKVTGLTPSEYRNAFSKRLLYHQ